MYNWSVNEKQFKKENPEGYKIWKLEQMINYGEPREKLDKKLVKKYWEKIKNRIDPHKRLLLEFLLWKKIPSSRQFKKKFLAAVIKEPYLLRNYYFTGGTVLSEFYLKHRISKDIDLFSEKEAHLPSIVKFVKKIAPKIGATGIREE